MAQPLGTVGALVHTREMNMDQKHSEPRDRGEETAALMYPSNQLKPQIRDLSETLSAFRVMKNAFFAPEDAA